MTAIPVLKKHYTLDEYLELDKNSEERYEYFDGEVFAMAGGSPNHARAGGNVYALLQQKMRGRKCEAFNSEMKIKVPAALPYRYPDTSVVCGEPIFEDLNGQLMLVNPILIVEVLSPSTAVYDLNEKFTAYQSIESFQEYLIVSQDRPHVIQHIRQSKGRWLRIDIEGLDAEVALESVNVTLPLSEIYERVEFQTS
ncbi:MAG: Uma2 family endonuclease [Acidobacteria bacterium]|nr:Uma2 family endonuclease [Acidobacteriota bacterium]